VVDWDGSDEPGVDEELVFRVVSEARRRRARRAALWVAGVLAAVGVVAVPLLLVWPDRHVASQALRATPTTTPAGASRVERPIPVHWVGTRAQIYAAVLSHLAKSQPGREPAAVDVQSVTCHAVASRPAGGECRDSTIPVEVQQQVRQILGGRVRFVPPAAGVQSTDQPQVVVFGELTIDADRASLGVEARCGPMCGAGWTLTLNRRHGAWQVTGRTGPSWIS
jgi:hypothetical protein